MIGFALFAMGANEQSSSSGGGKKDITIVVMPKLVGIPYFNASEKGVVQAGKDLGITVNYTGPTTADAADQVRMLEDLITKGMFLDKKL